MRKNIVRIILPVIIFIFGMLATSLLYSPPTVSAQTCGTPPQVTGVEVTYPSCVGTQCNFTQAGCAWASVAEAANYQVTITETDTGTVVYNQQVPASTLSVTVSITQGRTYQCNVAAVNSCGNAGPAGSHSLLCAADAGVSATPTVPAANPTTPPTVAPPAPTIAPPGAVATIAIAGMSIILVMLGSVVFLF
jgi:hypothetical protein